MEIREGRDGKVENPITHRVTNLLGRVTTSGHRTKLMTKQARAPMLQTIKISIRSHRLTGGAERALLSA